MVNEVDRHAGAVARDEDVAMRLKPDEDIRVRRAKRWGNAVTYAVNGKTGCDLGESSLQSVRDVFIEQIADEGAHVAADARRFASSRARARARRRCTPGE